MTEVRRRGLAPRRHAGVRAALLLAGCAAAAPARSLDFTLEDWGINGALRAQVSAGAAMRMQGRDTNLMGKLNLPGQEQFCEDKQRTDGQPNHSCSDVQGNADFLALPGYPSVNFDNGNMNYDRHDLVSAALKIAPRLQLTRDNLGLDVSGLYFYDAANHGFTEFHQNNLEDNNGFQHRNTPRHADAEDQVGTAFHLLDAYVSGTLPLPGERQLAFKLGNQVLSIGTSTTMIFNSLNVVNPPEANVRFLPGSDVRDIFQRIPLLDMSTNLTESIGVEAFYAFRWKPIVTPPIGGFFSTNDVVGAGGGYVMALFGKYREDPDNLAGVEERTQGNQSQLSDAGRTLFVDPSHDARNGGEYGATLSYFAQEFNNTTFTLTYMNLHSRLPIVSFKASVLGCSHDSTTAADAAAACQGFKTAANNHSGLEVAPIDSVRLFADYPEDIHTLGTSVSTNLGPVALTGEIVYRPNQPLQVDVTDVGFAALQPIFPANTIPVDPATLLLPPAPAIDIPGRRVAAPDYIETLYRGNVVQPGQLIRGYERFKTLNYNASVLLLRGASENPFGADQATTLVEVGAFHVLDLPPLNELQLGTPGVYFHHSLGVDGTGSGGDPNGLPQDRLNPSYQAGGYATAFSWGYRVLGQLSYEEVLPGVKVNPQFQWQHDMHGRAPLPAAEFVQGRKQAMLGLAASYQTSWSGALRYNWFFGGGTANGLADRDYLQLNVSYDF